MSDIDFVSKRSIFTVLVKVVPPMKKVCPVPFLCGFDWLTRTHTQQTWENIECVVVVVRLILKRYTFIVLSIIPSEQSSFKKQSLHKHLYYIISPLYIILEPVMCKIHILIEPKTTHTFITDHYSFIIFHVPISHLSSTWFTAANFRSSRITFNFHSLYFHSVASYISFWLRGKNIYR